MKKRCYRFLRTFYDRRFKLTVKLYVALILSVGLWFVHIAYADTSGVAVGNSKVDGMYLIGIIQLLIGYIYISGQKSTKDSIRDLRDSIKKLFEKYDDLQKSKLDEDTHDKNCPSKNGK